MVVAVGGLADCFLVCAIRENIDLTDTNNATITPIDIAGSYKMNSGCELDPRFELLSASKSNADAGREGVRVELHGGQLNLKEAKKKIDQRAIIEFVCDKERSGLERNEKDDGEFEPDDGKEKDDDADGRQDDGKKLRRRDENGRGKCEESDASLRFCGYELEKPAENKEVQTLRLEWRTKYACTDAPSDLGQSHWGFFTWFIIM